MDAPVHESIESLTSIAEDNRFRSATLRARTIRLAKESTKSAQPRHSPSRRYDTPLASDARNGRKHTYNLRHRQTKSNTG